MTDAQDEERQPRDDITKALSSIGWLDGPAADIADWCGKRWRIDTEPDAAAEAIRHLSEKYLELVAEQRVEIEVFCQATNDRMEEIKKLRELDALFRSAAKAATYYVGTPEEILRAAELRLLLGIEQ